MHIYLDMTVSWPLLSKEKPRAYRGRLASFGVVKTSGKKQKATAKKGGK
jgi:hypothetical protein